MFKCLWTIFSLGATVSLPNTRPVLSCQALLSYSQVNRFLTGKVNRSLAFSSTARVSVYLNYVCLRIEQCLLHHLHVHLRDYRDIRRTLNSTPGPSRPHSMHIRTQNTDIPRMWTDFGKTSLYSLQIAADQDIVCRLAFRSPAIIGFPSLTSHQNPK